MDDIHVHIRVDFNERCSIGPGKISLLQSIQATRSLSESARTLGMSYRRAWLLVHNVNESFDEPAVDFNVGGKDGGGAQITAFGERLIAVYRDFEAKIEKLSANTFVGLRPKSKGRGSNTPSKRTLRKRIATPL